MRFRNSSKTSVGILWGNFQSRYMASIAQSCGTSQHHRSRHPGLDLFRGLDCIYRSEIWDARSSHCQGASVEFFRWKHPRMYYSTRHSDPLPRTRRNKRNSYLFMSNQNCTRGFRSNLFFFQLTYDAVITLGFGGLRRNTWVDA
jgi:hypothetical protein